MTARLAGANRLDLGQNHEINVTPFVDVMLVLLIIFMVAAPIATSSIRLDLAPLVTGGSGAAPAYVSITREGQVFVTIGGATRATSLGALPHDLAGPSERRIFVRADRNVLYGRFMGVMDRLQEAGFYKVALVGEDAR